MAALNGTWIWQSFCHSMAPPGLEPWSQPGKLSATTDAAGNVVGKLALPMSFSEPVQEIVLSVTGETSMPGNFQIGNYVELTAKGDDRDLALKLRGYFVAGAPTPVIAGEVDLSGKDTLDKYTTLMQAPFVLMQLP